MAFVSVTSDVREEATKAWVEDFDDANIIKEQQAAYSFLSQQIGVYDTNHANVDGIRKLEQLLAAVFVLGHYSQHKDFANEKYALFEKLLEKFKAGLTGADITNKFATTSYKSYSAAMAENREQTTVRPHSSINPVTTYGMGLGGKGEPWQNPFPHFYDRVTTPRC